MHEFRSNLMTFVPLEVPTSSRYFGFCEFRVIEYQINLINTLTTDDSISHLYTNLVCFHDTLQKMC